MIGVSDDPEPRFEKARALLDAADRVRAGVTLVNGVVVARLLREVPAAFDLGQLIVSCPVCRTRYRVDEGALTAHVDMLLDAQVHVVLSCGGTGEFAYLTEPERRRIHEVVGRRARGKAGFIAHASAISTRDAIENAKAAEDFGADALMIEVHSEPETGSCCQSRRFFEEREEHLLGRPRKHRRPDDDCVPALTCAQRRADRGDDSLEADCRQASIRRGRCSDADERKLRGVDCFGAVRRRA